MEFDARRLLVHLDDGGAVPLLVGGVAVVARLHRGVERGEGVIGDHGVGGGVDDEKLVVVVMVAVLVADGDVVKVIVVFTGIIGG